MDQKQHGQQSDEFKGQQPQQNPQRPGSPQPGQQQWQDPHTKNPNREPAENPQHMPGGQEKGGDFEKRRDPEKGHGIDRKPTGDRERTDRITDPDLDREGKVQDDRPDRGQSQDESER